jgi:hypothetical protein
VGGQRCVAWAAVIGCMQVGDSKHAANGRRARRPRRRRPISHHTRPSRPPRDDPSRCIAAASRHICSLLPVPPSLPPLVAAQSPPPPPLLPVTISPEAGHWAANTHHGPARPANHTPSMDIARRHHPHHHACLAYHARPCGDGLWTPLSSSSMAAPISQEPSALWHDPLTCTPASCTCTCTCTCTCACPYLYTRHVVLPRSNGPEPTDAFYYLPVAALSPTMYTQSVLPLASPSPLPCIHPPTDCTTCPCNNPRSPPTRRSPRLPSCIFSPTPPNHTLPLHQPPPHLPT